jgi:hypothetical protein
MRNKGLLYAGLGALAVYLVLKFTKPRSSESGGGGSSLPGEVVPTRATMISALTTWINSGGDSDENKQDFINIINSMSDAELGATYSWVFDYKDYYDRINNAPQSLIDQIRAISEKYQIFT